MPLPLSVTAESVPPVVARATVSPPAIRLVPEASLSRTVIVEVELPSAWIEVGLAVIVEVAPEAGPGGAAPKVTVAVPPIGVPFRVPLTVPLPGLVGEVRVAVYVPSALSVTAERAPPVVERATVPPLVTTVLKYGPCGGR